VEVGGGVNEYIDEKMKEELIIVETKSLELYPLYPLEQDFPSPTVLRVKTVL
jgi:hypothetical protein